MVGLLKNHLIKWAFDLWSLVPRSWKLINAILLFIYTGQRSSGRTHLKLWKHLQSMLEEKLSLKRMWLFWWKSKQLQLDIQSKHYIDMDDSYCNVALEWIMNFYSREYSFPILKLFANIHYSWIWIKLCDLTLSVYVFIHFVFVR